MDIMDVMDAMDLTFDGRMDRHKKMSPAVRAMQDVLPQLLHARYRGFGFFQPEGGGRVCRNSVSCKLSQRNVGVNTITRLLLFL
jgi:hypothetical protein